MNNKSLIYLVVIFILTVRPLISQQQIPQRVVRAQQLHRLASQYEVNGQIDLAAKLYVQLSKSDPLDISSYVGAKRCLLKLNQYDGLYELITHLQQIRRDIRYEVDLAEIEFLKGDTKKAFAHWNRILEENSLSEEAYIFVGQTYLENRLYKEAIDCYETARSKLKTRSLFIFELAGVYTFLSEYELVIIEFLNYLEVNPEQINYIDTRISELEKNEDSIPKITRTLEKELKGRRPLCSQIHQLLGNIYTRTRNYEKAYENFFALEEELAAVNDKKTGMFLYRFAMAASGDKELEHARIAYEMILTKFPNSVYMDKSRIGLAKILVQKGMYLDAVNTYEKFVASFSQSPEAVTALIQIGDLWYSELFDIKNAENAYRRVLMNYPKSAQRKEVLFKLGDCSIIDDSFDTAQNYYLQIISESKNKFDLNVKKAQYSMARLEFFRGQLSKSLQYLNSYFSTRINNPLNPDYYENNALELQMLIQDYRSDSTGLVIFATAVVLQMRRQYEKAENILTAYIGDNPDAFINNDLMLLLADIYRVQGLYEKALNILQALYLNEKNMYRDKAIKKMAEIYDTNLNVKEKAIQSYETLLAIFPESIYIEEARKKIRMLER
ncbi:tetratricopeptide repeat protein [candidate division KSB1 bacterium]|nr:tetratricopeptide repeat protein [candidate division KSB1 bacterium]